MTFTSYRARMEEGAVLLLRGAGGEAGGLFSRCAAGLRELAAHADLYDKHVITACKFMRHFERELLLLRDCASSAQSGAGALPVLWESAFALLEDIVLFMREKVMRSGFSSSTEVERNTLLFFETSGHWKAGDGTLVSEAYYITLPATVLHEMLTRVQDKEGEGFGPELPPVVSGHEQEV